MFTNYASIDPKQLQKDSFRPMPILVKKLISWYALPSPQGQTASSMILGIDIAVCSATLLSSKPGHRDQPQSSGAQTRQGQEEDKTKTRRKHYPATEPSHKGQEEDKAWTQSPATEFRGAASECGQLFFKYTTPNSKLFGEKHLQVCRFGVSGGYEKPVEVAKESSVWPPAASAGSFWLTTPEVACIMIMMYIIYRSFL